MDITVVVGIGLIAMVVLLAVSLLTPPGPRPMRKRKP